MAMDEILSGSKVWVVDDTAVTRLVVADVLRTAGARIREFENGESALAAAREAAEAEPVEGFLLDIRLPDMNGIELCRALRGIPAYRNTPIIFVTSLDQREVLQWALEAGADDFIQKPLHAMVMRRRLANLMQKAAMMKELEGTARSLRRYVSPRAQAFATQHGPALHLPPPVRQEVCVLFTDARGFTEISQDMAPEAVFEVLSGLLGMQVDLVYRHGGDIDKYSGDGIMAVFDGERMAEKACRCALEILEKSTGIGAIRFGLGIHQGLAMAGNLGYAEHLDYTVIGPTVNLAARLCGLAGDSIVVSAAVRDAARRAPGLDFLEERQASVRGFREPVTICTLRAARN